VGSTAGLEISKKHVDLADIRTPDLPARRLVTVLTTLAMLYISKNKALTHGVLVRNSLYVVVALRYKPAGRGFDSRWCHWYFSVTYSFRSHYGPGVDSASNRNEYQVYFLGIKVAGA
jgi:hypothetical protein